MLLSRDPNASKLLKRMTRRALNAPPGEARPLFDRLCFYWAAIVMDPHLKAETREKIFLMIEGWRYDPYCPREDWDLVTTVKGYNVSFSQLSELNSLQKRSFLPSLDEEFRIYNRPVRRPKTLWHLVLDLRSVGWEDEHLHLILNHDGQVANRARECFDGTGYPISAEAISICAPRIAALRHRADQALRLAVAFVRRLKHLPKLEDEEIMIGHPFDPTNIIFDLLLEASKRNDDDPRPVGPTSCPIHGASCCHSNLLEPLQAVDGATKLYHVHVPGSCLNDSYLTLAFELALISFSQLRAMPTNDTAYERCKRQEKRLISKLESIGTFDERIMDILKAHGSNVLTTWPLRSYDYIGSDFTPIHNLALYLIDCLDGSTFNLACQLCNHLVLKLYSAQDREERFDLYSTDPDAIGVNLALVCKLLKLTNNRRAHTLGVQDCRAKALWLLIDYSVRLGVDTVIRIMDALPGEMLKPRDALKLVITPTSDDRNNLKAQAMDSLRSVGDSEKMVRLKQATNNLVISCAKADPNGCALDAVRYFREDILDLIRVLESVKKSALMQEIDRKNQARIVNYFTRHPQILAGDSKVKFIATCLTIDLAVLSSQHCNYLRDFIKKPQTTDKVANFLYAFVDYDCLGRRQPDEAKELGFHAFHLKIKKIDLRRFVLPPYDELYEEPGWFENFWYRLTSWRRR